METKKLLRIQKEIENISMAANRLKKISGKVQAIDRNASRILASVKMLELNISDVTDILELDEKRQ